MARGIFSAKVIVKDSYYIPPRFRFDPERGLVRILYLDNWRRSVLQLTVCQEILNCDF